MSNKNLDSDLHGSEKPLAKTRANGSASKRRVSRVQSGAETIHSISPILEQLDIFSQSEDSRELQKKTYFAVKESLIRGERGGTIKLPTGTGKTRIFANMLVAFKKNGLTLVPRVDLYASTIRDFKSVGFHDHEIKLLGAESGANTEKKMLSLLMDPTTDWSSGRIQCIMTYQALTTLTKKNPEVGVFMRSHFDIIIEDEAHRGLGDKTKEATGVLTDTNEYNESEWAMEDEDEVLEEATEFEAESILGIDSEGKVTGERYHYKFTATPDLCEKSVAEDGEYIFYATVEDAVRTGAIILPQYVNMGAAYTRNADLASWKAADIDRLAEDDNFVDEDGKSIREKIIDAYIEKKKEHGKLPAVAFASTIEHARQIVELMKEKGIRATRVTSGVGDISSENAVELIEAGMLDVIVTVTKLSEGFDYPPLACAMWFTPSLSQAKILQGNGRIMRDTDLKRPEERVDEQGKLIPSPNSYIIAPSVWYGGTNNSTPSGGEGTDPGGEVVPTIPRERKGKLSRIGNFYELLISQGELDINSLSGEMRGIIDVNDYNIYCDPGETIIVNDIEYMGLTQSNTYRGYHGGGVLHRARNSQCTILTGIQRKKGPTNNSFPISLIPKKWLDETYILDKNTLPICESGEMIRIEGIEYIGIVSKTKYPGVRGYTIISMATKAGEIGIPAKQKNTSSIALYKKTFVDSLVAEYICDLGEVLKIEETEYVGLASKYVYKGTSSDSIIYRLRKMNTTKIQGKQGKKSGASITLYPKKLVDSVLDEINKELTKKSTLPLCDPGEIININGTDYIGIIQTLSTKKLKGLTIMRHAKRQGIVGIPAKGTTDGLRVNLYPKIFVEGLRSDHLCEEGKTIVINDKAYIGLMKRTIYNGHLGESIIQKYMKSEHHDDILKATRIRLPGEVRKYGEAASQHIRLISKKWVDENYAVIKNHLPTCEVNELVTIDDIEYIGITSAGKYNGYLTASILEKAKVSSDYHFLDGIQKRKATNGRSLMIKLVPKIWLEKNYPDKSSIPICQSGETISIDDVKYIGILYESSYRDYSGSSIFRRAKNDDCNLIKAFQSKMIVGKSQSITLFPFDWFELNFPFHDKKE